MVGWRSALSVEEPQIRITGPRRRLDIEAARRTN